MAYQLRTGEMVAVMERAEMPEAKMFRTLLEQIGSTMAATIAERLGVNCGDCTYDLGMVGAPFYPKSEGQALPESMEDFDDAEEWAEG